MKEVINLKERMTQRREEIRSYSIAFRVHLRKTSLRVHSQPRRSSTARYLTCRKSKPKKSTVDFSELSS